MKQATVAHLDAALGDIQRGVRCGNLPAQTDKNGAPKPRSTGQMRTALKGMLDFAVRHGAIEANLMAAVARTARRRKKKVDHLTGSSKHFTSPHRAPRSPTRTWEAPPQPRLPLSALRGRFVRALTLLDERRANGLLELAFRDHPEEAVINRVVTPAGWTMASQMLQSQPERIGAYLFANVTRQVLNRQAARYPVASGPALWLACPRGEVHDVGLHAVRLMLAKDGWSTRPLGQNTDVVTLRRAARRLEPAAVLLTVSRSVLLHRQVTPLAALAREVPTFLGGPGVTRADGEATGATVLITPVDRVGALIRDHLSCNASLATPQPP